MPFLFLNDVLPNSLCNMQVNSLNLFKNIYSNLFVASGFLEKYTCMASSGIDHHPQSVFSHF